MAFKIRWYGRPYGGPTEGTGTGKRPPEKDVRGCSVAGRGRTGGACKKVVRPSLRAKMAKKTVNEKRLSIRQACRAFSISGRCFRYAPKLADDNLKIAELLLGLTQAQRNWGFGLCFLYLRNVKGYTWNHKRVYRIYRELELNVRIKPKKRIKRDKPEQLAAPETVNEVWSMDFMHDQLQNGRCIRIEIDIISSILLNTSIHTNLSTTCFFSVPACKSVT